MGGIFGAMLCVDFLSSRHDSVLQHARACAAREGKGGILPHRHSRRVRAQRLQEVGDLLLRQLGRRLPREAGESHAVTRLGTRRHVEDLDLTLIGGAGTQHHTARLHATHRGRLQVREHRHKLSVQLLSLVELPQPTHNRARRALPKVDLLHKQAVRVGVRADLKNLADLDVKESSRQLRCGLGLGLGGLGAFLLCLLRCATLLQRHLPLVRLLLLVLLLVLLFVGLLRGGDPGRAAQALLPGPHAEGVRLLVTVGHADEDDVGLDGVHDEEPPALELDDLTLLDLLDGSLTPREHLVLRVRVHHRVQRVRRAGHRRLIVIVILGELTSLRRRTRTLLLGGPLGGDKVVELLELHQHLVLRHIRQPRQLPVSLLEITLKVELHLRRLLSWVVVADVGVAPVHESNLLTVLQQPAVHVLQQQVV
eukprot:Hpha_TRINITY_DN15690_c3_g3::TRINITY_DN15690_c3_g3_i1::g.100838::m.100838